MEILCILRLLVQCDACLQFPGADTILVKVVCIHLYYVERCIGVVVPTAAKVNDVIDAAYLETARDVQSQRIIFAVAGVWKTNLSQ